MTAPRPITPRPTQPTQPRPGTPSPMDPGQRPPNRFAGMTQPDPVTDDTWPYPIPPTGPQTQPSGDDMPIPLPPPTPRTGRSS